MDAVARTVAEKIAKVNCIYTVWGAVIGFFPPSFIGVPARAEPVRHCESQAPTAMGKHLPSRSRSSGFAFFCVKVCALCSPAASLRLRKETRKGAAALTARASA